MDEFSEIVVFLRSSEVSEAPCPTAVVFCLTLLEGVLLISPAQVRPPLFCSFKQKFANITSFNYWKRFLVECPCVSL